MIDKKTSLTIDESLCLDEDRLLYILENFKTIDTTLLDLLQYYKDVKWEDNDISESISLKDLDALNLFTNIRPEKKRISPLHLAHFKKQTISANMILKFMVYIERKSIKGIFEYIPELLVYEEFMSYFEAIQFKTKYLNSKNSVRVKEMLSDDIVALKPNNSSYFDSTFFEKKKLNASHG